MTPRHHVQAPTFRSADVLGRTPDGPLPRRRLGRLLGLSMALHIVVGAGLVAMSLMTLPPVPPPPIVVTFLAPPPPPVLVPLREKIPAPEIKPAAPPRPQPRPPKRVQPRIIPRPEPPPVILRPAEPRPRRETSGLRAETPQIAMRVADRAPEVRIRDAAPPAPSRGIPRVDTVGASNSLLPGGGAEPELEYLVPGGERRRGPGGGLAGRGNGLPALRGEPSGGIRRGGGGDGLPELGTEQAFDGTGLDSYLGRKYGVVLVEMRRLGQRTSDGSRYALLLPMLSEACREIRFQGRRRGAAGDAVESIQVDDDGIAIRYRDGTLHVLVPGDDGLVALYISADSPSAVNRSKVEEAERALGALQRIKHTGRRG